MKSANELSSEKKLKISNNAAVAVGSSPCICDQRKTLVLPVPSEIR
ncbi:MAG: hypothetical protein M5T52_10730 [Ignavibacteriaceae bacterium]|nr:hypothetical protein [Ignavibacteriaceae bacterium]